MWNGLSPLAKIALLTFTILIVLMVIFLFVVAAWNNRTHPTPPPSPYTAISAPDRPVVTHDDPIRGNPMALFTIVEFGDFGCAACAEVEPELAKIFDTFDKNVRLVWKDVAASSPTHLTETFHRAARCAGAQGKFWEFHDALYAHFNERFAADFLATRADAVGIDRAAFDRCMETRTTARAVERGRLEAERLGVTAAPTFFINGKKHVGYINAEELTAAIEIAKAAANK